MVLAFLVFIIFLFIFYIALLSGINIEIYGFGEKFALVVKTISTLIKEFKCDKKKLELAKEEFE